MLKCWKKCWVSGMPARSCLKGKLIAGIRVRDPDGGKIMLKQSVIRNLVRLVDGIFFNLVGVIIIYRSPLNQRLGDKIAKTVVCRIR